MIRSNLKRLLRKLVGRSPPVAPVPVAPPAPVEAAPPSPAPKAEADGAGTDKPWYLDGSDAWGWENTNARDDAE